MAAPIFILGLPRSGTTLLQRLIATHSAVATTSEPWLMLPLVLGFREGHVFASYRQRYLAKAFHDFLAALPRGDESHREAVRRFAGSLYDDACRPGQTHFLDKTPRYHLIADDLCDLFPEASIILLWRNPLAIAASCVETWGRRRFTVHAHRIDLYEGLAALVETRRRREDRLLALRYEDLVTTPDRCLTRVFEHCRLSPVADAVEQMGEVHFAGTMGDRTARARDNVLGASRDSWPATFASPLRRRWAHRYLDWLGSGRLSTMGYELSTLRSRLEDEPTVLRTLPSDLFWLAYGRVAVARQSAMLRRRRLLAHEGRAPDVAYE